MTGTTPVTFQVEWALLEQMRAYAREHDTTVTDWVGEAVKATLRGDYERLAAERDAARADRVCWRETHNQVAAERDAADSVIRYLHSGARRDGDLWVTNVGTTFGADEILDDVTSAEADAIRRALDASPTEGNPE